MSVGERGGRGVKGLILEGGLLLLLRLFELVSKKWPLKEEEEEEEEAGS